MIDKVCAIAYLIAIHTFPAYYVVQDMPFFKKETQQTEEPQKPSLPNITPKSNVPTKK